MYEFLLSVQFCSNRQPFWCLLSGTDWKNIALPNDVEIVEGYGIKVSGILDMIHRNCMKVAFFGR